jgi:oxygen-independent coproporphyrinogen-3 oxidase
MACENDKKRVGIYIHVPFCLSKCHYCDFCSVQRADEETRAHYVDVLCREISSFAEDALKCGALPIADTVYFGGGTPTLLSSEQFEKILETVEHSIGIADGAEITAETNPKSADGNKLAEIRRAGVNRLSIGMQSVHDSELRALGRIHNFDDFKTTFFNARGAGFDNISADLMYGIPLQTEESFAKSVETLAAFEPEHISSYSLTVEEGTNFYRRRDSLVFPDEDAVSDMYSEMCERLVKHGYGKYEISNFAKAGRESRHNLKYWKLDDYVGFGPAAHSCFDGVRSAHSRDIDAYLRGESIIIDVEKLSKNEAMNEYVMLGMRLASGIDLSDFFRRFGVDFLERFGPVKKYAPDFVTLDDKNCRFTERGMLVSNFVLSDILEFDQ